MAILDQVTFSSQYGVSACLHIHAGIKRYPVVGVGMMIFNNFQDDAQSGAATPVPTRAEIPDSDTWDLSHLFANDDEWENTFQKLSKDYVQLSEFRGRVGESAQTLSAALEAEKASDMQVERLYHYASLRTSEDASSSANLQRMGRMQNLLTRINEASSFLQPEIQAIPDADFESFLQDASLAKWHMSLGKLRRYKPHTLSDREERLMALGSSALSGHSQTFGQLTNVDMKFGEVTDADGKRITLTQSSLGSLLLKPQQEVRERAFRQFYEEIVDHQFTLASSLAHSVRADVFRAKARNYPSAREASLFHDRVPVEVYDNLISAVHSNLEPLQRYYELRRRKLGINEIHHYDTYVPFVGDPDRTTTWDEAVDLVIASLQPLGSEYTSTLEAGLRGRWCDRYETKGKRSGAFSSSSYGNPPYILMNFKEDVFTDVFTLTHEAGHSMHTWYSQKHQRYQDYDYPIFTAEVASTFNEELLMHHLLATTEDPGMRAYLISREIDDIRGTLFRQTMFAEFEKVIHEIEESGEALTLEVFRAEYRKLLDRYFAGKFVIDPQLENECLRIPHFYNAFYVYKYATGISAAITLAQRVLKGGERELEDYLGFLKSGGSRYPIDTLQSAGVDMSSPGPVNRALARFGELVTELEELIG